MSAPVVSTSSRPTGTTGGSSGLSSPPVGRPCGSGAVVTTPAGLWRRTYLSRCPVTSSPSTSTRSCAPTTVLSCPSLPLTVTRPALINSPALLREATPARARNAFRRILRRYGRAALHLAHALDVARAHGSSCVARPDRGRRAGDRGGRREARGRLG